MHLELWLPRLENDVTKKIVLNFRPFYLIIGQRRREDPVFGL